MSKKDKKVTEAILSLLRVGRDAFQKMAEGKAVEMNKADAKIVADAYDALLIGNKIMLEKDDVKGGEG